MINAITSAVSALQVQGTRQQVTSNNVANSNTEGFAPSRVISQENSRGGVTARIDKPTQQQPGGTSRPVEGTSQVDMAREMIETMETRQTYQANMKTITTADNMQGNLLDIKA